MSQQAKAKEAQGYDPKPAPSVCINCKHFTSEKTEREGYFGGTYIDEKKIRCGLGGFAVKKMATCEKFERSAAK